MNYQFLNIFLDPKELLTQSNKVINPFLLENNTSQIEKIYDFYKSNVNLLYVNGFLGTGKTEIIDYSTAFLAPETIVLKYNCFNSTILDDILLSFFTVFKKMSAQNIILEPKVKTENFSQKVNSYFSQIDRPFVIIMDSFEDVLEENRQEILDFIFHLNSMQKVKIIIIGKTFESKYFKNVNIDRITTLALENTTFEKYLKSEKIKFSNSDLEELYKYTRGYYFYTLFSIKLMKKENLPLFDFLIKFKNSFIPFPKFLEKQIIALIPPTEKSLLWLLSIIRHSISISLLKKLGFYDEEKFKFLVENNILAHENSQVYVQEYLKEEIEESTAVSILHRVHRYLIDLYSTQLPLRPLERDICISRQTMRKEIEYHKLFLPKIPQNIDNQNIDINYLSYSKVFDFTENKAASKYEIKEKTENKQATASNTSLDLTQRKNIQINIENLPFSEKEKKPSDIIATVKFEEPSQENFTIKDIFESAKIAESKYDYTRVIDLFKEALLMKNDKNYQIILPLIYSKLAHAYQKIAKYENSLKYYELLQNIHENAQDFIKVNNVKFNIARIFYETYKLDKAKELLLEIISSKSCSEVIAVKSYLQLANLEESMSNSQNAYDYYKKAIELSDETMSEEVLTELYFKYALAMDDRNDTKIAIEFYNKCINVNGNAQINKFLSPTYSNIATLYLEKNDIENAIKNYIKAYEIDKQDNNLEGMYYSSSKLASILQRKQPEKALEYLNDALDCAKLTKDIFYIVSASLSIGDFHYDKNQNEIALKYYMNALNLAKNSFSQDNINKIKIRVNDIKFKIGVEKFNKLVELIKEE